MLIFTFKLYFLVQITQSSQWHQLTDGSSVCPVNRTSLSMTMNRNINSAFRDLSCVMKDQTSSKLLLVEKVPYLT